MNSQGDVKTRFAPDECFEYFLDEYENDVLLNDAGGEVQASDLKEFAKFLKPRV